MIEIKTLENSSLKQITETFNEAFLNYFFKITFSQEQFEDKFATEGGRPDLSVGAFENGKLVGFILHFVEEVDGIKYVYNGGTGVIEAYRGNKLTARMYDFIRPLLKANKIDKMILEVLTENTPAINVYKKQGYNILRELYCFSGQLKELTTAPTDDSFRIVEINNPNWDLLKSFWDYKPTWQNSIATVSKLPEQKTTIGIEKEGRLIAYILYNHKFRRIHHMAVSQDHRNRGLGSKLLAHLFSLEKNKLSFINIDTRIEGIKSFLEKRGLSNYTNQYEMITDLN